MSKGYIKDVNGRWRLTDKQEPPIVVINQQEQLTLENVNLRLQKLEGILEELMK